MNMGSNHGVDEQGEGSNDRDMTNYEVNVNEIVPLSSHGRSESSTSSPDDEDLFEFDGNSNTNDHRIEKSESESKSHRKPHVPSGSTSSDKQVYLQSRIPSSVFSGKPGTGTDWSAASNESLFSINVGNGSFSKDQYHMLYKSGELTKLDEQIIAQKDVLPSLKELDDMAANKSRGTGHEGETEAVQTGEVAEDSNDPKMARTEEVQVPVSHGPIDNHGHGTLDENISMENKHTVEVHNAPPINKNGSVDMSFSFPVLTTAADGGRLSAANTDQNKGIAAPVSNPQQPLLPEQPPEVEEQMTTEITEENEPENPVVPENDPSQSWFSWLSCCRRS